MFGTVVFCFVVLMSLRGGIDLWDVFFSVFGTVLIWDAVFVCFRDNILVSGRGPGLRGHVRDACN